MHGGRAWSLARCLGEGEGFGKEVGGADAKRSGDRLDLAGARILMPEFDSPDGRPGNRRLPGEPANRPTSEGAAAADDLSDGES